MKLAQQISLDQSIAKCMEEHYVLLLLQRVIDENTRLREAIEARDNEQKRVLEELSAKLENSTSTPARAIGRKRK